MIFSLLKTLPLKFNTGFNIALVFLSKSITALTIMLVLVSIARKFGAEGSGIFTMILLISSLAFSFGNFGLDNANIYYLAKKEDLDKQIFFNTFLQSLAMSLLTIFLFLILCLASPGILGSLDYTYFLIALFIIPLVFLEKLLQSIFVGQQNFRQFCFPLVLSKVLVLIATWASIYILKFDLLKTMLVFVIFFSILPLWYLSVLIKKYGFKISFDKRLFLKNFSFGLKSYLVAVLCFLILRSDLYLINIFGGLKDVGLYSVATNFFDGINLITASLALVLFPKMAFSKEKSYQVLLWGSKISLFLIVPSILITIALAKPLIVLLFGLEFLPAVTPFIILLVALIFWSLNIIANQYFASIGLPIYLILLWLGGFIFNLLLNIVYIPKFGIIAASFSSLATYAILCLASFKIANCSWKKMSREKS